MKRLLLIALCLMAVVVNANDFSPITLTLEMAADSTSTTNQRTVDTTEVMDVGHFSKLAQRLEIDGNTNWTNDSIFVTFQYSQKMMGPWILVPGLGDTALILTANDTLLVDRSIIIPRDSTGRFIRAIATHSVTPGATPAKDSAGISYSWVVNIWIDDIKD